MPPAIVIDTSDLAANGSGTVHADGFTSDGSPVAVSKWTTGSQSGPSGLSFFQSGGTAFTGSFDIPGPGTYTVYMKNSDGGESLRTINVSSTELTGFSVQNTGVSPNEAIPVAYDGSTFTYSGAASPDVTSVKIAPVLAEPSATVVIKDDSWNVLAGSISTGFTTTISGSGKHSFTIAVVNGETGKIYKLDLYAASPLDVALTPSTTGATSRVTVNVEASGDYNSAYAIRWATGVHTVEDFSTASFGHDLTGQITVEDGVSKADFDVEENGDYSVYVRDAFSAPSVSTIRIENIVKDAPSISFGNPDPDEPTAGEVSVPVTVAVYGYGNGNQLKEARWKPGQLNAASFAGGAGTDLLPELTVTGDVYQGQLTVSDNGWYTVYALDTVGNESVNSVKVTNIFPANSDLDGLALSQGDLTPAFSPSVVNYTAAVGNSVSVVSVTPTPAESHSTVTVNGTPATGGTPVNIPLVVGTNTITIAVTALDGQTKTYTITVTRAGPSRSTDSGSTSGSASDPAPAPSDDIQVIVDGKPQEQIATGASSKDGEGRSVFTVSVDAAKLSSLLEREGDEPHVLIPVARDSDIVTAVLTGDAVKAMENKRAVLEIRTPNGNYKLPAVEMFIDRVSSQLGNPQDLSLIEVRVEIARSGAARTALLEDASENGRFTVVVPPVEFTITASYNGNTVMVDKFSSYVQREIPLPNGADPSKITTAVVLDPDGTVRHVPTSVIERDGRYFAVINSLTNSTYSLIWHPAAFPDVERHWARDAVNDMASRMVVSGVDASRFDPDASVTRAEFAAMLVRALGLPDNGKGAPFTDVKAAQWYAGAAAKAQEYGIANGYPDGAFRPFRTITREEAAEMLVRAMKLTGMGGGSAVQNPDSELSAFADGSDVSRWARPAVAQAVRSGLLQGFPSGLLPKKDMTRAEAAAVVQRLLIEAKLIDG
jgi:hypothetical protein